MTRKSKGRRFGAPAPGAFEIRLSVLKSISFPYRCQHRHIDHIIAQYHWMYLLSHFDHDEVIFSTETLHIVSQLLIMA